MFCIGTLKKYVIINIAFKANIFLGGDQISFYDYIEKDPESGPKAQKCKLCGKVGNDRGNLRKHVENIHFPGSFEYYCKYCGKSFNAKNNMYFHISKMHRDQ